MGRGFRMVQRDIFPDKQWVRADRLVAGAGALVCRICFGHNFPASSYSSAAKGKRPMVFGKKFGFSVVMLVCLLLVGCGDNPGNWPEERVKAKIQEKLELVEVSISERQEGGFEGSGKRADGETVEFEISQNPDEHQMSWEATGDRGFVEEGFYELR